jgi:hypothetical protein
MPMTKEEWLSEGKALRDAGISIGPEEIFGRDELEKVDFVKGYRTKLQNQNNAFERKQKEFDRLDELKSEHEKQIAEKDKAIKSLQSNVAKVTAKDKFQDIIKGRNLGEKPVKFLEARWDKLEIEDPEKVDESLNKFIDTGLIDFKKNAEIFGVNLDESKTPEGEDVKAPAGGESGSKDYTKPENNPLIPKV